MDRYEHLVQQILKGQQAPLIDGERHILVRCGQCEHVWLMQGKIACLDLDQGEVQQWARRLGANLADLPDFTCRDCAVRSLGGEFALDEYAAPDGRIWGYGYSWEGVAPPAHMLVGVSNLALLQLAQPQLISSNIVTDPALARAVLSWLGSYTRRSGLVYQPFPPVAIAELSRANPPGAHARGTEGWVWRGAAWQCQCDPLGGIAQVTFAWAGEPTALSALPPALDEWSAVAQRAAQHSIAGEL
jgi:hypothetical protein